MFVDSANSWAPSRGWDHESDVVQAKRYVQGMAFAALPNKDGHE